jgi:hypothetical protein
MAAGGELHKNWAGGRGVGRVSNAEFRMQNSESDLGFGGQTLEVEGHGIIGVESEVLFMTICVDATIEKGQLKIKDPVELAEGTAVRVTITPVGDTITPAGDSIDPLEGVIGIGEGPPDGADNHDKYIYGKLRP